MKQIIIAALCAMMLIGCSDYTTTADVQTGERIDEIMIRDIGGHQIKIQAPIGVFERTTYMYHYEDCDKCKNK